MEDELKQEIISKAGMSEQEYWSLIRGISYNCVSEPSSVSLPIYHYWITKDPSYLKQRSQDYIKKVLASMGVSL